MMNLCSLYKSLLLTAGAFVAIASVILYELVSAELSALHLSVYGFALLLTGMSLYCLHASISVIKQYRKTVSLLSMGEFESRIVNIGEKGLLGSLAKNLNHMADIVDAFVREACNSMEAVSEARYYRKVIETGMPGLFYRSALAINAVTKGTEKRIESFKNNADTFETKVRGIVERVMLSSEGLHTSAEEMLETAGMSSDESQSAATSVSQTSHSVTIVSASVEELSASIAEIDNRVTLSVDIAAKAHEEAMRADELIRSLDEAAKNIGNVIALITDIAKKQTCSHSMQR